MTLNCPGIAQALAERGPFARIVVAGVKGSAPRGPGTAMFVWADRIQGTIGGGALEWHAMALARQVLTDGAPQVSRMPLGPALNQCCGGAVTLVIERIDRVPPDPWVRCVEGDEPQPSVRAFGLKRGWIYEAQDRAARHIHVWGAGHVGWALTSVLSPFVPDIRLSWYDVAEDRFPPDGSVAGTVAPDMPQALRGAGAMDTHLIVTHSHDLDLALCHAALTHGFGTCGLIGSATKWARFRSRLAALGHGAEAIDRITCPIGDPGLGKHPQAIAVGVAARLLSPPLSPAMTEGSPA
ncbi:MAG: xanthine dehydrogenase accessory protein XdhC [Pseudomonadota bacterium]